MYLLARLLQEKNVVALQIGPDSVILFDEHGIHPRGATLRTTKLPRGAWALSDSYGTEEVNPCPAFQFSTAHLVHTSSPARNRWKSWMGKLSGIRFVMDVWPVDELRKLLYVR